MLLGKHFRIPKFSARTLAVGLVLTVIILATSALVIIESMKFAFESSQPPESLATATTSNLPTPFPLSVNPHDKIIVEDPTVATFFETEIAQSSRSNRTSWLGRFTARLAHYGWYQSLASSISRVLVILPGERQEEVTDHFGDILGWSDAERETFNVLVEDSVPALTEGKYFPDKYLFPKDTTPETVAAELNDRFSKEVLLRYSDDVAAAVPLEDALTIASLIEREAYDFTDMREISGVIWNRLFIDMNLQIDASLQYAKGSLPSTPTWWPSVLPRDKYIDSDYNTYQNPGLPPTPINSPSLDAILAALNPTETDCLFYFHDRKANFHCSPTYEGHVAGLKEHYGRGR